MKVFLILLCFVTLAVSAVSGYLGCEPGQKLVVRHFPSPTKYMYGLGVKVRNMKMDFNIYDTWRRVGQ